MARTEVRPMEREAAGEADDGTAAAVCPTT